MLAAPKPTHDKPTNLPTEEESFDAVIAAEETPAMIEMIEPSTGEIIVLAQHKPVSPAKAEGQVTPQVTPIAKPEKRTKGRAKLKTKPAEDGTTPDTTATAKSDAGAKSAEVLAANEARKERKAAAKEKAKAKPARGEAKAGKSGAKVKKAR